MRRHLLPCFAVVLIIGFLFPCSLYSQQQPIQKSEKAEEYDRKALEKLRKMSPKEVEELDKKLARALTLYYDRDYARALPIFQEISGIVETMDIAFWLGSCAAGAGKTELAIKKFKQMLSIDPNLHRVRLELARVYFEAGMFNEAKAELNRVLEAKPPDAVKKNIERMLAQIEERTKKVYTNFRFSLGIQGDSNVSAGPDEEKIYIPPNGRGGVLTLSETQKELSDTVGVISMAGNILYDFGKRRSWMWNTTGSLYQTHTFEYEQFDFTQVRFTTGPWWTGRKSIFKMPFGYVWNLYEHSELFRRREFSPSYEYFFNPGFSLKGTWSHTSDRYEIKGREGEDNTNRIMELNPNFYFNNRRDILSFYVSDEMVKARERRYSYDAVNLAVSYYKKFKWFGTWDMEFYSRFKYSKRDYLDPALLWPVAHLRTDKRGNFYTVLSRNFSKHCFASISFNYIRNESNTDLYDFTKFVYGFNIGFKF